jgi:serine/threonine-protein kinase
VAVPSVIGLLYDPAAGQLQAAAFALARNDVDSDAPKGPNTVQVPDVTGHDLSSARQTLRAAGFTVTVTVTDTDDESLDGLVASQSPLGGTQAEPKATVSIEVWRYVAPAVTTETTTTDEPLIP